MNHTSATGSEARWRCPRAGYYRNEFGARGIEPAGEKLDRIFGIVIHEGLAEFARKIGETDVTGYVARMVRANLGDSLAKMEGVLVPQWQNIAEGMIWGFGRVIWPNIVRDYEVVAIEQRVAYPICEELEFVAIPDLILRNRKTGDGVYLEYKTTSSIEAKWLNSWNKAVQVHAGLRAAQKTIGLKMSYAIVLGLYKGYKDQRNQIQSSVFAYGWRNLGTPGVMEDQLSYTFIRGKGWERFPISELYGGEERWVREMPEDILRAQFAETPPIMVRDDLVDAFYRQERFAAARRRAGKDKILVLAESAATVEEFDEKYLEVLDEHYPQHFACCDPAYGFPCEFRELCWQDWVRKDPVGSGLFVEREEW